MVDYRKILGLLLEGRSYREVVEIVGCSHRDVVRVRQEIQQRGLTSTVAVSDVELAEWFPDGRRNVSGEYHQPDLSRVLASMKANRHFTLLLAWRRYVDTKDAGKKYGYSQFCALFTDYLRTRDLVAVLRHEPGRAMLVDWAGDTMDVVDTITGEVVRAILFVAVLPYSGLIFCRAYVDMKSPAWLDAHVQAFAFFGGVTQIVVPDNPTTSTHQTHKGDAERVVNARYQQLADHYQTAIVPARVKKPCDKAAAENAVNVVKKRVIGYLEDDVFTTLGELNTAIEERVREVQPRYSPRRRHHAVGTVRRRGARTAGPVARRRVGGRRVERAEGGPEIPRHRGHATVFGAVRSGGQAAAGSVDVITGDGLRRAREHLRAPAADGPQEPILDFAGPCPAAAPRY